MFDRVRQLVLRYLRVPAEPEPPFGAPGSARVFRAGRNYYRLRLLRWLTGQIGAAVGIVFSLMFIDYIQSEVDALRAAHAKAQQQQQTAPAATPPPAAPSNEPQAAGANPIKRVPLGKAQKNGQRALVRTLERWPGWIFPLMHFFEYGALALFVAQIPFSYAVVRLEFEQHWYIVTDRSLRIRTGLFSLQESTMSFANLQQVQVQQGPLQRLLGLADVHVQSAGGGGDHEHEGVHDSLHKGIFHSVENAPEIRDLILERLRVFRATGLGDPDDAHAPVETASLPAPAGALAAACELLAEARALRQTVSRA